MEKAWFFFKEGWREFPAATPWRRAAAVFAPPGARCLFVDTTRASRFSEARVGLFLVKEYEEVERLFEGEMEDLALEIAIGGCSPQLQEAIAGSVLDEAVGGLVQQLR